MEIQVKQLDGGSFKDSTGRMLATDGVIRWDKTVQFVSTMKENKSSQKLEPNRLKLSVYEYEGSVR